MAGIRKRTWKNKRGTVKSCYEITYYLNGKQCRKSGYATKQEAQEDLNRVTGAYSSNSKLKDISNYYIDNVAPLFCRQTTLDLYRCYHKIFEELANKNIKDITKQDIEFLRLTLLNRGYSKSYLNVLTRFIKSVFKYATENKYLSENPITTLKPLKLEKNRVSYMTEEELAYFIDAINKVCPQYFAFLYTAVNTGMRRGELFGLEWNDIDFKSKTLKVQRQIYDGRVVTTKTETSKRTIHLPNNLVEVLKEHKLKSDVVSKYVFCDWKGQPINRNTLKFHFEHLRRYLNAKYENHPVFEKLHLHDLRHTYATILLSNGASIKFISEQLGHSSAKMTLDTYSHCIASAKDTAINILENLKCEHFVNKENPQAI